jgi:protein-L-isoaspartate(D-aspartate) O-methyltransferase
MVERQIRTWDVLDPRILALFEDVPRENFVPGAHRSLAYADAEIPLGDGQVMMTPKLEARMLQALDPQPGETALEIGTGSGFVTACLASLGAIVTSADIRPAFLSRARASLDAAALNGICTLLNQDASTLTFSARRYNVICVTGSLPKLDASFADRLEVGGRLFAIVGAAPAMEALLITRVSETEWARESLFETVVPTLDNAVAPSPFVF